LVAEREAERDAALSSLQAQGNNGEIEQRLAESLKENATLKEQLSAQVSTSNSEFNALKQSLSECQAQLEQVRTAHQDLIVQGVLCFSPIPMAIQG